MKISEEPAKFRPITIVLETEEDVQSLLQMVQVFPDEDDFASDLYRELYSRYPRLAFPVKYTGEIGLIEGLDF